MALRSVTWAQVAALRLERQHLVEAAPREALLDVVAAHVGVQAQVMSSAELALRARVDGLTRDDVRDALWRDRTLVKTWAMRGTLHLVAAQELGELVRGLGTRLNWLSPVWLRYFEVTADEMRALQAAIGELLTDEPVTRQELADALAARLGNPAFAAKVAGSWGTFLKPAASAGRLVFGPDRGRNVTFVHPAAWLGRILPEPADEGVDAVLLRHVRTFPGASKGELARWWGVSAGQLNPALRRLGDTLELVDLEGTKAYVAADDAEGLVAREAPSGGHVRLLGGFDPYTLSLQKEAEPLLPLARRTLVSREAGWISAVLLVGGAVAGTWTHETKPKATTIDLAPWRTLTRAERSAAEAEAQAIGAFLAPGIPVALRVADPA